MSTALTVSQGTALDGARRWVDMSEKERRLRATEAARDRDLATLWDLTHAVLILYGKSGNSVSPHTARAYRGGIASFVADTQAYPLLHLTRDHAATWARSLEERGASPGTVSLKLAAARWLYRALRWAQAASIDPFEGVRPPRDMTAPESKRSPYSESDLAALLAVATGTDRITILLGSHSALRAAEIMDLRWEHVDFGRRSICVFEGKGGKTANVDMSRSLMEALLPVAKPIGYVIDEYRTTEQARNRMRALCLRAGVKCLALHSLRHYAGTRIQIQLGDIRQTARHLRHQSTATTEIYVHHADTAVRDALHDW